MPTKRFGDACAGFRLWTGFRLPASRPVILDAMESPVNPQAWLDVAIEQARKGRDEGGLPIGAAIFTREGKLLGAGHNRRVQHGDPSAHGETDAFRNAGRQRSYRELIMVTTLAPCWYCSGLVRQFGFRTLIVGESRTFQGGVDWLRSLGVEVIDLDSQQCVEMMSAFIREHPEIWNEDIGQD
jgi:cytosine/creatinine deaminase